MPDVGEIRKAPATIQDFRAAIKRASTPLVVRSHRYGRLKFRRLSFAEIGELGQWLEETPDPRDFCVRVLHHQLVSPEMSMEEVSLWPDRLLLRAAAAWSSYNGQTKHDPAPSSFVEFQEQQRKLSDLFMRLRATRDAFRKTMESAGGVSRALETWRASLTPPDYSKALASIMQGFQVPDNSKMFGGVAETLMEVQRNSVVKVAEQLRAAMT